MKDNTTLAREMYPPILILECPGPERTGSHLWAALNPRWMGGREPRPVKWCPKHQQTKKNYIRKAIIAERAHVTKEWDKLPLPASKRCCNKNPDPEHHERGAVLPAILFYARKGAKRKNGTRAKVLDSRCKMCRRAESARIRDRKKALSHST